MQRTVLGKGLASLLPGADTAVPPPPPAQAQTQGNDGINTQSAGASAAGPAIPSSSAERHMGISLAKLEDIRVNPFQPRRDFDESAIQELADSIRENGVIQPLVVRKTDQGYELIAGERRLRASKLAGVKQVPIVIRKTTDRESLQLAMIENIQRRDLNCIDEALGYFQLMQDFSLTQEEVAKQVGKERATVANCLRLLKLPAQIIEDLKNGTLSPGHGKILLSLESTDERLKARQAIIDQKLSVRSAEEMVDQMKNPQSSEESPSEKVARTPVEERLKTLARDLTRIWATRVRIKGDENKGKIVLQYSSREELEKLLTKMQN